MNTPKVDNSKKTSNANIFVNDVINILGPEHKKELDKGRDNQLDYFERFRETVKEIRKETDYDYTDIEDYEKRLLADDCIIEQTREKLRNHDRLKPLIEEYKTIPGQSNGMEIKIWNDILLDLFYESMEDIGKGNEGSNIDMGGKKFGLKPVTVIKKQLADLPKDLKTINLQHNFFGDGDMTLAELKEIFSELPKSLQSINLLGNGLGKLSGEDLKDILSMLPKNLKVFNLGGNYIGKLDGGLLKDIISILPKNLKVLKLWANSLREIGGDALIDIISEIPKDIKFLDLSGNLLGEISGELIKDILSILPKDLKSLNLMGNRLGNLTLEDLENAISNLPEDLKYLDLSSNEFGKNEDEIRKYCESRGIYLM